MLLWHHVGQRIGVNIGHTVVHHMGVAGHHTKVVHHRVGHHTVGHHTVGHHGVVGGRTGIDHKPDSTILGWGHRCNIIAGAGGGLCGGCAGNYPTLSKMCRKFGFCC